MNTIERNTYQDYVIKDGKFIGDLNILDKNCDDPWAQSNQPNKYSRLAGIEHIRNFDIKSILECGCGPGHYAYWIHRSTGILPTSVDISEEAVAEAQKLFPHMNFQVSDITKTLQNYKDVDCILFCEIIWYILPSLYDLFVEMKEHFKDKYLIVNQAFYKGIQDFGKDYFTSLDEFINFVPFKVLGYCEASTVNDTTIETSTIFRIK